MKKLFSLFLFLPFSFLLAQEDISVLLKDKSFSIGAVPSFVVFIPQASYDQVNKDWEKYLKQATKEKTTVENGEISISNKLYEKISPNPINIYSYVKEYDGEIMLVVAFDLNGEYISREMDEEIYIPTKKYVRDFAVESYQKAVEEELKEEEKALKKLQNQKNSLLNSKESILSSISQYERNIVTSKDAITINQIDQSNKIIQVQAQKDLVLKLANDGQTAQDDAEKILKELERDFKKMQNKSEGLYQEIDYNESEIRKQEIELAKIESEIKFIGLDIDDQTYKVRKVQQKLEGIN